LTQISAISTYYDFNSNTLKETGTFNKKIKLSDETKAQFNQPGSRVKWVLSFNHYGQKGTEYFTEDGTLSDFYNWVSQMDQSILIIQNAEFDMKMLNVRSPHKFKNEVIDTKQLIQLFYLPTLQKLAETDQVYKDLVNKIGVSDRDNGLISSSMSKIGSALGINMSGYHDALTDCRIMSQMFCKMIDFLKEHQSLDISKYQSERIMTKRK
jgi:DNA polymerase III alpha subunit (gram-positive type)